MQNCKPHHTRCNRVGNTSRNLPARLVHIEPASLSELRDSSPVIKVVVSGSVERDSEYVAFSHCWGGSAPFSLLHEIWILAFAVSSFGSCPRTCSTKR